MATKAIQIALGRECSLSIGGERLWGVSDVSVRETCTQVDATGYGHNAMSSAVVTRTYEIVVSVPDMETARSIYSKRWMTSNGFLLPRVVDVELASGLMAIDDYFTIHEVDADEPLDGVVVPRFSLRQWHAETEEI